MKKEKMKFFVALVAGVMIFQSIFAQNTQQGIKGKVIDAENAQQLESVNLILAGTNYGTISKSDGSFELAGIPEGKYELQASMIGYKPSSQTVTVRKNNFTTILLELIPDVVSIDSVIVIGRKQQNYIAAPNLEPLSLNAVKTKVSRDEIVRQGAVTLVDAMNYVPGAMTESRGRKVKQFFSVRGQKYPYPDYAINGIWQKEFLELPYFISASDIEEVEIIRSSAALITGLSGLTGVINIKTRSYEKAESSVEAEYGTFNTMHLHASHGGKSGNVSYAAGVGYDKTDGPKDKNAAEEIGNVYSRIEWQATEKLDVSANLYYLTGMRELALAEPPASKRLREEISSYDQVRSTLSNIKIRYKPSENAATELHVYYSDRNPIYKVTNSTTQVVTFTSEKDHEWGVNLIQALNISEKNTLRFGGLYNHWVAPNGKRFYVGRPCDLETISGVITDEHILGAVTLDGGIRWSRVFMNEYGAFDIGESGTQFTQVVPIIDEWQPGTIQASLGATWNLSPNTALYYHSAIGNIKPREGSLTEDFSEPLNETRLKFDLGYQTKWLERGKLSLTGFFVNQKDAISLSGGTYDKDGIILEFYQNKDQDQFGFETEVMSPELFNLLSVFGNFTAMRSRIDEAGEMIKNKEFPEIITNGGIQLSKYGFDLNVYSKYVGKYESSRFVAQVTGQPTIYAPLGDFFTLDLTSGYTFGSAFKARIYLRVQNITDKRYSTVAGYPDFGRQFRVGLRMGI